MASQTTRDHHAIQRWARAHGATPAVVSRPEGRVGMLRFEFSAQATLDAVHWSEFFRIFDERGLELIYDDQPGSPFHKLAYPETIAAKESELASTKFKPSAKRAHRRAA